MIAYESIDTTGTVITKCVRRPSSRRTNQRFDVARPLYLDYAGPGAPGGVRLPASIGGSLNNLAILWAMSRTVDFQEALGGASNRSRRQRPRLRHPCHREATRRWQALRRNGAPPTSVDRDHSVCLGIILIMPGFILPLPILYTIPALFPGIVGFDSMVFVPLRGWSHSEVRYRVARKKSVKLGLRGWSVAGSR